MKEQLAKLKVINDQLEELTSDKNQIIAILSPRIMAYSVILGKTRGSRFDAPEYDEITDIDFGGLGVLRVTTVTVAYNGDGDEYNSFDFPEKFLDEEEFEKFKEELKPKIEKRNKEVVESERKQIKQRIESLQDELIRLQNKL